MKFHTTILLVIAFAASIVMSSCTKNYTCQCSIVYTGYPGLPDSTEQSYTITNTPAVAKSQCQTNTDSFTNNGIKTVEKCVLY